MSFGSTGTQATRVRRRDGTLEPVDVTRIAGAVARRADDLDRVDPLRVATRTIGGLFDGVTTEELDRLAVQTAADLIGEEPQYSRLAARLLAGLIAGEVAGQGITSFSEGVANGHRLGLVGDTTAAFVAAHAAELDELVDPDADRAFEYFGIRTVQDRYLLRHPRTRLVVETPQRWLLRVACGLSRDVAEAAELYRLMASLAYLPSSPTLFNSGTAHPQMSSCFLVDSPRDELESIYERYGQVARLSKFSGGIGIAFSRVRSRGALIRGTNGRSNGIVPWLRTLDASVAAVNQGGRRKGAACVYLEPWHPDIEEFLELRDNTGEDARRTHNLSLAHWIPDEFMRRVHADEAWSLMDPDEVPELTDLWGDEFDRAYRAAEAAGRHVRQLPARDLYTRMMRTLAQTGNGWMTFKDAANRTGNQTAEPGNVIHLSNLCTEILEVTSDGETAVCNLGSVNLARHVLAPESAGTAADTARSASAGPVADPAARIDWAMLRATVRTAVTFLDRVIDINYYPTAEAAASNPRWRPIGLGVMGLQDVFFALRLPFDSAAARELSTRLAEEIALTAFERSVELAREFGPHPAFARTRAARGVLHPDHFDVTPTQPERWAALRAGIAEHGLRNCLLLAIAPTATIASIAGCYECIEPQVSNVFKRETLSGEFLQINNYLVEELRHRGLWTAPVRERIKAAEGSVQELGELPDDIRALFRTAWELPQRALIDLAIARMPYVDQSQSLNLFMADPNIGRLSSMYSYAWSSGLKTTYYLRSRPATRIQQATVAAATAYTIPTQESPGDSTSGGAAEDSAAKASAAAASAAAAVACSLENPEICEACQ
ncbi:ribonucleoside-diphosphate reductase subunit alpha [Pseudofrankia asymbiotica]|uniref:Ribonucleoside-diphosphate reductase n=1 Tax=Pseudofrankia asymbiotica TaxID=1834516 RepID=A0A1V2I6W5_9ACTN|nr:ribonucleoside-diphosphate reductase subunit alpha [Pseudofrankia asymbiotica]ONH27495.1 ribonucleoside-diphosphate reductase subunit alpha [Pseudofrankia asymbiotica]